jgi:hypothetical protein
MKQRGPTPAWGAIQRKVGFEFETNCPIWWNNKAIISKGEVLYTAPSGDWSFTSDAGFIEFVTEPFEEEGALPEKQKMIKAITEMSNFMDDLYLAAKMANLRDKDTEMDGFLDGYKGTIRKKGMYVPSSDMAIYTPTAKPQVTGGVELKNIGALFQSSFSTGLPLESPSNPMEVSIGEKPEKRSWSDKTPLGGFDYVKEGLILIRSMSLASSYVSKVRKTDITGWDKLEGMLSLVYSYLLAQQDKIQDLAKYFLPMMSRMSFSAMYKSLPQEVRKTFNPEAILKHAGLDPMKTVYNVGYKDPKDLIKDDGPVRQYWIESIVEKDNDQMSFGGDSSVTEGMKASSPAMGQHATLDPSVSGVQNSLVQIELRRLPGSVPTKEWVPLATSLFEMFQAVQAGQEVALTVDTE